MVSTRLNLNDVEAMIMALNFTDACELTLALTKYRDMARRAADEGYLPDERASYARVARAYAIDAIEALTGIRLPELDS